MDVYLIRHTKTATEPGLCYGRTEVALSGSFAEDACNLITKLPEITRDTTIIASPLSRCTSLAELLGQPFKTDERLLEVDFGAWENRRFDQLDQIQVKHWADNFVTVSPPGGENFKELCDRVGRFWEELLANQQAGQVLIITHAGVIRALLAHVLQLPPANAFKFRVDAGSLHKLECVDDYTYIRYLNR
jgi:alpha-ribazole phosphatase